MKLPLSLLLIALIPAPAPAAAPRDLGLGLIYCRVHTLPGDLPGDTSVGGHPCVLDLRYVAGGPAAAEVLAAWVAAHGGSHTPILLLANAETSPGLIAGLGPPGSHPGVVILGAAASSFQPDIALSVAPQTERQAYAALETGASIESLLTENPDKPRNDEARLAREHLSDSALASGNETAPGNRPSETGAPPRLVDSVLQRAVHLHRALLALGRL